MCVCDESTGDFLLLDPNTSRSREYTIVFALDAVPNETWSRYESHCAHTRVIYFFLHRMNCTRNSDPESAQRYFLSLQTNILFRCDFRSLEVKREIHKIVWSLRCTNCFHSINSIPIVNPNVQRNIL